MKPGLRNRIGVLFVYAVVTTALARAQGATSGSITGTVRDSQDLPLPAAHVTAVHEPSGSRYETVSRPDGRYTMPAMRVGGPYTVTAAFTGLQPMSQRDVMVGLGITSDVSFRLGAVVLSAEVAVAAQSSDVFSVARTGAATTIGRRALATLPTIGDRLNDFGRLVPQYTGGPGGGAFAGADNRQNNITVDGAYFNNSFGLSGQPGDRTGVAPITIEAIEEIQVNVAPYDVSQSNFVGAAVNVVTLSGDNEFRGASYYRFRDDSLVGTEAKGLPFDPGTFDFDKIGGWISGPVRKDRLSLFLSYEHETLATPGTPFRANTGTETVQGNTTRVLADDLDYLRTFVRNRFGYETGPYQGYGHTTPASRVLAKANANIDDRNKVTLRYNQLDSSADELVSNVSALGFGNRRSNTTGLTFKNSNYKSIENIASAVGEWSSVIGKASVNWLVAGYTTNDESRANEGEIFPFVDILEQGAVYTSFGFEPFTPSSELRYNTFQLQDTFRTARGKHSLTVGASFERFRSENVFFPGSQSVYVYNSQADFYADVAGMPVTLRRFQVRWSNIPGQDKPIQPLRVNYVGGYAQDEWTVTDHLLISAGARFDVPFFDDTGYANTEADGLVFRDRDGTPSRYSTATLPGAHIVWSPRIGVNWSPGEERRIQLRGGTGIFTGKPAYVWISNQIGNTGVLTGFEQLDNTTERPFSPNPDTYKPAAVTGAPAPLYELALTDPAFRFPQVWRTNLAVDRRLPWNMSGTLEGIYTQDVNGISYINANLPPADWRFVGADDRPRWTVNRIHSQITSAVVLDNAKQGHAWNLAASLAKTQRGGFLKAAYAYSRSRSTVQPGAVGVVAWSGNPHSGDPNNPNAEYFGHGHRVLVAGSYRFGCRRFGDTTLSFFFEGRSAGNGSYTYAGDLNGDGGTANDLIYVPRDQAEMSFQTFTQSGRTFTAVEQAAAWDAYIAQDRYLSTRRGRYAERNGVLLPMVRRLDVAIAQVLFAKAGRHRQALEVRADFLNVTNLLNSDWGVATRLVNAQPLTNPTADADGRVSYRLRAVNGRLMTHSFESVSSFFDVYRIQFSVKYSFN
jgi:hypothetical protein